MTRSILKLPLRWRANPSLFEEWFSDCPRVAEALRQLGAASKIQ
jgi:hypothetical protein